MYVFQLYNAEEVAKGFYKRPDLDSVTAELMYFDFGGFQTGSTFQGLSVISKFLPKLSAVSAIMILTFKLIMR